MKLPNCVVFELCERMPLRQLAHLSLSSANSLSLTDQAIEQSDKLTEDLDFEALKSRWRQGTFREVHASHIFGREKLVRAWEWTDEDVWTYYIILTLTGNCEARYRVCHIDSRGRLRVTHVKVRRAAAALISVVTESHLIINETVRTGDGSVRERVKFFRLPCLIPEKKINKKLAALDIFRMDYNPRTKDMVLRTYVASPSGERNDVKVLVLSHDGAVQDTGPMMDIMQGKGLSLRSTLVYDVRGETLMEFEKLDADLNRVTLHFQTQPNSRVKSPIGEELASKSAQYGFFNGIAILVYTEPVTEERRIWIRSVAMEKSITMPLDESFVRVMQIGSDRLALVFRSVVTLVNVTSGDKDFFPLKAGAKIQRACLLRRRLFIFECETPGGEKLALSWDARNPEEEMTKLALPEECFWSSPLEESWYNTVESAHIFYDHATAAIKFYHLRD